MSPAENTGKICMILVQNIDIPAYSKITAHKFVKVKFFGLYM